MLVELLSIWRYVIINNLEMEYFVNPILCSTGDIFWYGNVGSALHRRPPPPKKKIRWREGGLQKMENARFKPSQLNIFYLYKKDYLYLFSHSVDSL